MVAVFGSEPGSLKEVRRLSPESDPVSVYDVTADPSTGVTSALSALTLDDGIGGSQYITIFPDSSHILGNLASYVIGAMTHVLS